MGFLLFSLPPDQPRVTGNFDDIAVVHKNENSGVSLWLTQAALFVFTNCDLDLTALAGFRGQALEDFVYENCVSTTTGRKVLDVGLLFNGSEKDHAVAVELVVQTCHRR